MGIFVWAFLGVVFFVGTLMIVAAGIIALIGRFK